MKPKSLAIVLVALGIIFAERSLAAAQPQVDFSNVSQPELNRQMHHYFAEEYLASKIFISTGVLGITYGFFALSRDSTAIQGSAIPTMSVGLVHLIVGMVVYARTPGQRDRLAKQLAKDPALYKKEESARMDRVVSSFEMLKITELILLASGTTTAIVGGVVDNKLVIGIGAGLAVEAGVTLALDLFAESRARFYRRHIRNLQLAFYQDDGDDRLALGYTSRF